MNRISSDTLKDALSALGAFLEEATAEPESFVLIGGSALLALGLISRTTQDADIMAGVDLREGLVDPRPMSEALRNAARRVAREYDLEENWLNTGPAAQVLAGLPVGRSWIASHLGRMAPGSRSISRIATISFISNCLPPSIRGWGGTSPISQHSLPPILKCSPPHAGCSPRMQAKSFPPSSATH